MAAANNKYLAKIYYDPSKSGSFTGVEKLWNAIKKDKSKSKNLNKAAVKAWLQKQDVYSVYKLSRRNYATEKIIVSRMDMQWDADLMDMSNVKSDNEQVSFVLVVIDLFSR